MDKVLIVTATKVEAQEILDQFSQASGAKWERCHIGRKTYYSLGKIGGVDLFMVQSEMGTRHPGRFVANRIRGSGLNERHEPKRRVISTEGWTKKLSGLAATR